MGQKITKGKRKKKSLEQSAKTKHYDIIRPRPSPISSEDTLIYYGLRYNELGRIDPLGMRGDQYLCIVLKDGVYSVQLLDEEQIKDKGYQCHQ